MMQETKTAKVNSYEHGRLLKKADPFVFLLLAYGLFIIVHVVLNGYSKHIETYWDEWIYYRVAECLVKGMGFPSIYGDKYPTTRFVYSLLISPAFLVGSRVLQFRLIALINALLIGSGIFPVWLLTKTVIGDRRYAALAGVIYLLQPDMQFTASFMSENVWLPVSLWVIYFFFRMISEEDQSIKNQIRYIIPFLAFTGLLIFIKDSGLVIVLFCTGYYIAFHLVRLIKNLRRHTYRNHKRILIGSIVCFVCVLGILLASMLLFRNVRSQLLWTGRNYYRSIVRPDPGRFIWCYIYTWATEILAVGVFPVLLPLVRFRALGDKGKQLFRFSLLLTAAANIGTLRTSINVQTSLGLQEFPLYQRYIIYLWILFFVVFLDALKNSRCMTDIKLALAILPMAGFLLVFRGVIFTSTFEASLLHWTKRWMESRRLWTMSVLLFLGLGTILLQRWKKWFICIFSTVMLIVQVFNHYEIYKTLKGSHYIQYSEVQEVENFIRTNPDKRFFVVDIPVSIKPRSVHLNAMIADTFLVYPNTYFASVNKITEQESEQGLDLTAFETTDVGAYRTDPCEWDAVDYIVLSTELSIDEAMCDRVLENRFFTVFSPDDKSKIPYIVKQNEWDPQGVVRFQPEAGFYSNFYENDRMTYVSGDHPDHVLFGPYVTLMPGRYKVTIQYSYDGETTGRIGYMDVTGNSVDPATDQPACYAEQKAVSVTFDLTEQCENFEVRLFSEVAGIEVKEIDVYMEALNIAEGSSSKVYRYSNSSGLVTREEYYSLDGEKMNNTSGYHAAEYVYENGNRIESRYYDLNDQPVMTTSGYAVLRCSYNNSRQVIREEYFDTADEPAIRNGYYAAEFERDDNGDPVETRYFGKNGERLTLPTGQAMIRRQYDEARRAIREEYYGLADGEDTHALQREGDSPYVPILRTDGYFAVEYGYDQNKNINEYRYYDLAGKPVLTTSGYAILRRKFNAARQIIREEYYGTDSKPVNPGGYYAIAYDRDTNGDAIGLHFLGEDGGPVELSAGQSIVHRTYDTAHRVLREEYCNQDNIPILRADGYSAVTYNYDVNNNISEYRYYDLADHLVLTTSGYAILRREYNSDGKIIRELYYGTDDEPVNPNGYYGIEYIRGGNGEVIETRYLEENKAA